MLLNRRGRRARLPRHGQEATDPEGVRFRTTEVREPEEAAARQEEMLRDPEVAFADRLEERGEVPFILIDAAERSIETPILQFPLWLAFAGSPEELYLEDDFLP